MTPLLRSLEDRSNELASYLRFVELIEKESASLSLPGRRARRRIDDKVLRILKANFFLLLYNVVEASIREGVRSLYAAIDVDKCAASDLTPVFRTLWINAEVSKASGSTATPDTYRKIASRLVDAALTDGHISLDVSTLKFGGSLDAAKIRELCEAHGVSHRADRRTRGGEKLLIVKDRRNALAHGDLSFVECGRDYTVAELKEIKVQSCWFLKCILRNIERSTARRTYRA